MDNIVQFVPRKNSNDDGEPDLYNEGAYTAIYQIPNEGFFKDTDTERFVRLVVREQYEDGTVGRLRGSHLGMPFMARRRGVPEKGYAQDFYTSGLGDPNLSPPFEPIPYDNAYGLMTNVRIPYDPNEWYFICATYNPTVEEDSSHLTVDQNADGLISNMSITKDFWLNHIELENPDDGTFTSNNVAFSNYGNRCKVEIISRSDLLRARGFRM